MSSSISWEFRIRAIYGRNAKAPNLYGECCTETRVQTTEGRNREIDEAKKRPEIGKVWVFARGGQWELMYDEDANLRGEPGSLPDPVRLLEMAEALYQAEREECGL